MQNRMPRRGGFPALEATLLEDEYDSLNRIHDCSEWTQQQQNFSIDF
jgi:hypothetical protein